MEKLTLSNQARGDIFEEVKEFRFHLTAEINSASQAARPPRNVCWTKSQPAL